MTVGGKLPAVIVTSASTLRDATLLSDLVTQLVAVGCRVYVGVLPRSGSGSDAAQRVKANVPALATPDVSVHHFDANVMSVANVRASLILLADADAAHGLEWVLMADDDALLSTSPLPSVSSSIDSVKRALTTLLENKLAHKASQSSRLGYVSIPFVDVDNRRGYLDWELDVYTERLASNRGLADNKRHVHLWAGAADGAPILYPLRGHGNTHGLWSVPELKHSGVLDLWQSVDVFRPGRRCYDAVGSQILADTSQTALVGGLHMWHRNPSPATLGEWRSGPENAFEMGYKDAQIWLRQLLGR